MKRNRRKGNEVICMIKGFYKSLMEIIQKLLNFEKAFIRRMLRIISINILAVMVILSSTAVTSVYTEYEFEAEETSSTVTEVSKEPIMPEEEQVAVEMAYGQEYIYLEDYNVHLENMILPFNGEDFNSMQPYEDVSCISNESTSAFQVTHNDATYIDHYGLLRYNRNASTEFTVDGKDDYVVALGTFYKGEGTPCGGRFLIVTDRGSYTVTVGDEKDNIHTGKYHMYSDHDGKAGLIEFIVDEDSLESTSKAMGSIFFMPNELGGVGGNIHYIYKIS